MATSKPIRVLLFGVVGLLASAKTGFAQTQEIQDEIQRRLGGPPPFLREPLQWYLWHMRSLARFGGGEWSEPGKLAFLGMNLLLLALLLVVVALLLRRSRKDAARSD